ncbi:MAG: rhomboid family intramembrane serine protease [Pseudomonadota bacterium]
MPERDILTLLLGLIGLCASVELVFLGNDLGLWGSPRLRQTAYEYGGFWPGLLHGWRANFPGQAWVMFVSYAILHAGPGHLIFNMITLWTLGHEVGARAGARGLALIYSGSVLGGALGYGILTSKPQPMVGASGALFGLAGALLAWTYLDRKASGQGLGLVIRLVVFLIAINVVMYWALDGHLAWQTHLGGVVTGAGLAFIWRRKVA